MLIRRPEARPPWPAQALAVVSAGMSMGSAYAMLFKPGMGHETWLSVCLWTFTTVMGLLRAVLLMFCTSPAMLNAASAVSLVKVLAHCLKAVTIPPKFLQRLFVQGTRHFLTAYTISYLVEMGFARITLPWYLAVACSEAHALCVCFIIKRYVPEDQYLRDVVILHVGAVVVPLILTSFFSFKTQSTMQRVQTNGATAQQLSMCATHASSLENSNKQPANAGQAHNSCAEKAAELCPRLRPRACKPSQVTSQSTRPFYKSRLQTACSQVTIKLSTSLHVSDLPSNAVELLQNAIRDAGNRCGRSFNVLQTSIRDGCILISTSVMTQLHLMTNEDHADSGGVQQVNAMQLAQALLPDLICRIHPDPGVFTSDHLSLQVGHAERVVAKWETEHGQWVFEEDEAFSRAASKPALGLAMLDLDKEAPCWQAALHGGEQQSPCSCHANTSGSNTGCHKYIKGARCTETGLITNWQSTGPSPQNTNTLCAHLSVQLLAETNTVIDVIGWDLMTPNTYNKKTTSLIPAHQSVLAPPECYHLIVQGSCGFGKASIVNGMDVKTKTGESHSLQVEVLLPAASLARHHEGGPCAALQPLTLELWAGDAWVSTTHCILPLTDTHFGWWGNIPACVAVAAAQELQASCETLVEAAKHDPADCFALAAAAQAETQRTGMQELICDLNYWLSSLCTGSTASGLCMMNSHPSFESSSPGTHGQQGFVKQTGLPEVELVRQLHTDLIAFAAQCHMPALKLLLTSSSRKLLYAPSLVQQFLMLCFGKTSVGASNSSKAYNILHALKAAAVGSACKQCELLYEHRMRSSTASVYGCSSLVMFVGGLVAVFKEAAVAQSVGIQVGLWAVSNGVLSYLLLTRSPGSSRIVRRLTVFLYLFRLSTNAQIAAGVIQMLPSVKVQHMKGTWPLLYMFCSIAERTPVTGTLPPWLITALGVLEATMLYTVTSSQFSQWWRLFASAMSVLIVPWLLDAHLRSWIWAQQLSANRMSSNNRLQKKRI